MVHRGIDKELAPGSCSSRESGCFLRSDTCRCRLPPKGVYAVYARTDDKVRLAVLNIGIRPTLQNPNPQLQAETHLLDFTGDLYGQELELTFLEKLRDEKKFDSLAELRDQIGRDIFAAQSRFFGVPLTPKRPMYRHDFSCRSRLNHSI